MDEQNQKPQKYIRAQSKNKDLSPAQNSKVQRHNDEDR